MEHFQTESPTSYESSKIKHTVLVGKEDISKSDDEYGSDGFYVRDKIESNSVEESPENSCDKDDNVVGPSENGDVKDAESEEENESVQQKGEQENTSKSEELENTNSSNLNEISTDTDKNTTDQSLHLEEIADSNGESDYLTPDTSLKENNDEKVINSTSNSPTPNDNEVSKDICEKNETDEIDNKDDSDSESESEVTHEKNETEEETDNKDDPQNDSDSEVTHEKNEIEEETDSKDDSHNESESEDTHEKNEIKEVSDNKGDSQKDLESEVTQNDSEKIDTCKSPTEDNKENGESENPTVEKTDLPQVDNEESEEVSGSKNEDQKNKSESEELKKDSAEADPKENEQEEDKSKDKDSGDKDKSEDKDVEKNELDAEAINVDQEDSSKAKATKSKTESEGDQEDKSETKDLKGSVTSKLKEALSGTDNKDSGDNQETKKDKEGKDKLEASKSSDGCQNNTQSSEQPDEEEMEYDFDPSLLCPDISMDVDEAPVITNNDNAPNDGSTSPLPYEQSFSTYVDEMTGAEISFDLTPDEITLKEKLFGAANPIQFTKIHCTACNVHLGSALDGQKNRFVHPLLKVLICKNCYHFYTSGEFEKDEDGSELYCRWCGQGGQVLCCSSCEFVFCKRCIKNNFGLKKFKEIRDSDDWNCFRCEPQQLSILRASCAEFIDYVRGETAKASTLAEDVPSFMAVDHTTCCNPNQKKKDGEKTAQPPRRKRKMSADDPDFSLDQEQPEVKRTPAPILPVVSSTSPSVVLMPRAITTMPNRLGVVQVSQRAPGLPFRLGQTSFRPRVQPLGYTITRPAPPPQMQTRPNFIKVLPPRMLNTTRPQMLSTMNTAPRPSFAGIRPRPQTPNQAQPTQMKHEWFEKTVRAAARVNSNLSYTLTQLNRQQSTATSVEGLALIHNKLQEVLSTSINSLIQIRKNLRTEFIAGIKNIKFPPKAAVMIRAPFVNSKDDDDVIFVNPTTASSLPVPPMISLPSAITLTSLKKTPPKPVTEDLYSNPTPSTSYTIADTTVRKGGYLKVKSFSALQNVSSECITIPDDPLPPPPALTPIINLKKRSDQNGDDKKDEVMIVDESPEKKTDDDSRDKKEHADDDVVEIIEDKNEDNSAEEAKKQQLVNGDDGDSSGDNDETDKDKTKGNHSIFIEDVESHIASDKKLKVGAFIHLERCKEIEEILKRQNKEQAVNGDT